MTKISALIPTFNNEDTIESVIDSVKWCDDIFIIDSFSTDSTVDIIEEKGIRYTQRKYVNSANQKNWALQHINTEWTLQIDTDEFLEEGSELEIRKAITNAPNEVECFRLRRKNHMWGDWIKHGRIYPDLENRIFRTKKGLWFDREVHSNIRVNGSYENLSSHILHYGMPNISKQLKNLDRYTDYEALQKFKQNNPSSTIKLIVYPLVIFFDRFLLAKGFLDGFKGLFLAVYTAFYYFLSQAKLKELYRFSKNNSKQ